MHTSWMARSSPGTSPKQTSRETEQMRPLRRPHVAIMHTFFSAVSPSTSSLGIGCRSQAMRSSWATAVITRSMPRLLNARWTRPDTLYSESPTLTDFAASARASPMTAAAFWMWACLASAAWALASSSARFSRALTSDFAMATMERSRANFSRGTPPSTARALSTLSSCSSPISKPCSPLANEAISPRASFPSPSPSCLAKRSR
mmetsp:Transcript_38929/g.102866  ORF Transcript_38929/g.102866 Transcript_38929/m.102866 type:complete len:204 (+) Transcript_38929:409-1020(+)